MSQRPPVIRKPPQRRCSPYSYQLRSKKGCPKPFIYGRTPFFYISSVYVQCMGFKYATASHTSSASGKERDHKQDNEDEEQNLRNAGCSLYDTEEAEDPCNQCNN